MEPIPSPDPNPRRLLVLTGDVFIVPRIEDVARGGGFEVHILDRPEAIGAAGGATARAIPLTEPLEGADAAWIRWLVLNRPGLIAVDIADDYLPWERWIAILKSSAATRRIPVLAFGPHVDEGRLRAAERAGADRVLARGEFLGNLAGLLSEWARVPDAAALARACQGRLSDVARQGVELINAGEYFEAHEVLEKALKDAPEADGYLYRTLLQVAVTLLQLERGNPRGARKMLLRIRQWLDPLPEECQGIDLRPVRTLVGELEADLDKAIQPPRARPRFQIHLSG